MPSARHSSDKGSFTRFVQRYSTALTATLGVVTCVTGVMLFFHSFKAQVTAMHEWLGVGFVIATLLHLVRHWKPFSHLLKQRRMQVLTAITVLIVAAFVASAGARRGENPMRQTRATIGAMSRAPLATLAPVFGLSSDEAVSRLAGAGIRDIAATQTLDEIARTNGVEPLRVLATLGGNPSDGKPSH